MPPVYEVRWIDAYVSTSETSIKSASKMKPCRTVTVGFLVYEGDEGIVLAMDWWPKTPKQLKAYTFIPWGMVEQTYHWT
jgi:hypothetical protein